MVGLLGIAAAGAAIGARDASNAGVEAEREALRDRYAQQYEESKYQRGRADNKEDAAIQNKAALEKSQLDRENQLADTESKNKFKSKENQLDRDSKENIKRIGTGGGDGEGGLDERLLPNEGALAQKVNVFLQVNPDFTRADAHNAVQRSEFYANVLASPRMEYNDEFAVDQMAAYDKRFSSGISNPNEENIQNFIKDPDTGRYGPAK